MYHHHRSNIILRVSYIYIYIKAQSQATSAPPFRAIECEIKYAKKG